MLVQFGNSWIQKIPLTAKIGLGQFWQSSEFFSSNYFQIGQYVVLLHIKTHRKLKGTDKYNQFSIRATSLEDEELFNLSFLYTRR